MTKQGSEKGRAGAIFTAAMVLCCIGLYLLGGRESENVVGTAEALATAVPAEAKQRAYPAKEVFFANAEEYGLSAEIEENDAVGPLAESYTLIREELADGKLVLSKRNGGICAFTLILPAAPEPETLPNDPTPVEISLYEQRITAYELEKGWLEKNLAALVSSLDVMGELNYGDMTSMLSLTGKTVEDGKDRSMDAGNFKHTVSLIEDRVYITVSIEE